MTTAPHFEPKPGRILTLMTATDAVRAYNRFVDDWPADSWLIPSFVEWAQHKNIKIVGEEQK